ncbi:MAG: hypothetical protein AAF604_12360 [Acidobacteriota bacterium]
MAHSTPPPPRWPLVLILLISLGYRALSSDTFDDRAQVTAVDLVVELPKGRSPDSSDGFTVLRDGQALPVVAVDGDEPWSLVLYFDRQLTAAGGVAWAADLLSAQAESLTALGPVEVVVADATADLTGTTTRDPDLLRRTLAALTLEPPTRHLVADLRGEFLAALAAGKADPSLAPAVAAEEGRLVRERQDLLLSALLSRHGSSGRRAVLLVSDGFDLEPASFYRLHWQAMTDLDWSDRQEVFARTLAAYGWIVAPLVRPEPEPPERRWGPLRSIEVRIDRNWNPAKARAFVELGDARRGQGLWEDAADAYRQAVYHFYGQPKLATEEAAAEVALGEVLQRAGKVEEAQRAFRQAVRKDPSLAGRFPELAARLIDPLPALEELATTTLGRLVRAPGALEAALDSLGRRVRLTYQVSGFPDGRLHAIEVESTTKVESVRWSRWGTPPRVAEGWLRDLLSGGGRRGGLTLTPTGDGSLTLRFQGEPPAGSQRLRLSLAHETRDGQLDVLGHRWVEIEDVASWSFEIAPAANSIAFAVIAEDFASGWRGEAVRAI